MMVTSKTLFALAVVLCWLTVATQESTTAGPTTTTTTTVSSATPTAATSKAAPKVTTPTVTTQQSTSAKAATTAFAPYACLQGQCQGTFDCVAGNTAPLASCNVSSSAGGCNVTIKNGTVSLGCDQTCDKAKNTNTSWCCQTVSCNKQPLTPQDKSAASQLTPKTMLHAIGFVIMAAVTSSKL